MNEGFELVNLFNAQAAVWKKHNQDLFGLTAVPSLEPFIVEESLKNDQEKFWNNGTCKLKDKYLDEADKIFKNKKNIINGSWKLSYNKINHIISLSADFIFDAQKSDEYKLTPNETVEFVTKVNKLSDKHREAVIENKSYGDIEFNVKHAVVCYLPLVTQCGYKIKDSEYALRIQAARNEYLIRKKNGKISHKNQWTYENGVFSGPCKDPYGDMSDYQKTFLRAVLGKTVTRENFTEALDLLPEYDKNSVLYFTFLWFDEVEQLVLKSTRKVINAQNGKNIDYSKVLNSHNRYVKRSVAELNSNLVAVKNKIKALETVRSVLFPSTKVAAQFSFTDSARVFDAFKVTTNIHAGRSRVLLDDLYIKNGMIMCKVNGVEYNQWDIVFDRVPGRSKNNLSAISRAPYNFLNDAKRIMLCSKLRTQAVQVSGQLDDLTHEVPARVVFSDHKGFSYGDSFIISESFAKKLERDVTHKFDLKPSIVKRYSVGQELTVDDLVYFNGKNRFSSYRDIKITDMTNKSIVISARCPMGVGDKITNLHGSKGIATVIVPDEKMPCLLYDINENMPAGPMDVIVPGISVYRRKASGQLFEAMCRVLGIGEMPVKELYDKYKEEIFQYDSKCKLECEGRTFSAPCGINHMIRLDHDATSKQSFSYIKTNYNYNLQLGEMEVLNLAARGKYDILNELDLRSINKHTDSFSKIKTLQETGFIAKEPCDSYQMRSYFKYLGWDFSVHGVDFNDHGSKGMLTNEEIDLF